MRSCIRIVSRTKESMRVVCLTRKRVCSMSHKKATRKRVCAYAHTLFLIVSNTHTIFNKSIHNSYKIHKIYYIQTYEHACIHTHAYIHSCIYTYIKCMYKNYLAYIQILFYEVFASEHPDLRHSCFEYVCVCVCMFVRVCVSVLKACTNTFCRYFVDGSG
jgi:hypothetical protein